jgi:hypothetical protein
MSAGVNKELQTRHELLKQECAAKDASIAELEQERDALAAMLRQVDEFLAGREIAAVGGTDYKTALHQLVTLETSILSRENAALAAALQIFGACEWVLNNPNDPLAVSLSDDADQVHFYVRDLQAARDLSSAPLAAYRAQIECETLHRMLRAEPKGESNEGNVDL